MWAEGCVDLDHVAKFVRLNAAALSDPDSLYINVNTPSLSILIRTLIDSVSSHCFLDSTFAKTHSIPTFAVPLIRLHLFDGTYNSIITEAAEIPITFPTGITLVILFYVTLLDSSCFLAFLQSHQAEL